MFHDIPLVVHDTHGAVLPVVFTLSCTRCYVTALQHDINFFSFPSCNAIVFRLFVLLSYVLGAYMMFTTKNSFSLL
jgi:hypothetical protein